MNQGMNELRIHINRRKENQIINERNVENSILFPAWIKFHHVTTTVKMSVMFLFK